MFAEVKRNEGCRGHLRWQGPSSHHSRWLKAHPVAQAGGERGRRWSLLFIWGWDGSLGLNNEPHLEWCLQSQVAGLQCPSVHSSVSWAVCGHASRAVYRAARCSFLWPARGFGVLHPCINTGFEEQFLPPASLLTS